MRFPLILAAAGLGAAVFVVMALPAASQQPSRAPSSGLPAALSSSRRTDAVVPPPASPDEFSPRGVSRPETSVSADAIGASGCYVTLMGDGDVEVPAQEQGVLMEISVREGQSVKKDDSLAQVDDSQAKMAMEVAKNQWLSAQAEADNEVSILYARAAFAVAQAEVQQAFEANGQQPNTFSRSEVLERQLKARQYELQIQQAQHEKKVNGLKADEKHAELDAATLEVTRRQIKSPLDGIVVKRSHHPGEWVKPGDPVVHIVRADRLRIEGRLDARKVLPAEIINQPVAVTLDLPNGKRATFRGNVVYANPVVEAGMQFEIHAEVENQQDNGFWLLRPGLFVQMTIQRKKGV
jgi:multidrug efflux pump subunit AcrA (membrane-fusion protein)